MRERGAARRERDQVQAAQSLGAIAAVVKQVAFGLDEHAAAVAGQQADGEMVGQRAGGQPDGRLLTEQRGHASFQLLHDAPARKIVRRQVAAVRQGSEQLRVFGGRVRNAVAEGIDARLGLGGREWVRPRLDRQPKERRESFCVA